MTRLSSLAVPAALWLATVVAGSLAAWAVISQAGAAVGTSASQPLPVAPTAIASAGATPGGPTSQAPSATPTAGVTVASQRGVWTGAAGRIVATCAQGAATGTATPEGGWTVSAKHESGRFKVEFAQGEQDVKVSASCSADGAVLFTLDD